MCGIAGFMGHGDKGTARAMASAMSHRGPDDEGMWRDAADEITLVHRRLAVIDLSPKGRQPMQSASRRYQLVFNGEIYNHPELRKALKNKAPRWRGTSDTETLLAAIDAWGLAKALTRCHGMFALALWDTKNRTLSLARDRMGEKPLYYGEQNGAFLFASELRPITRHPAFENRIDRGAVAGLMQYDYIPAPMSIYEGIRKLEPGRILTIRRKRGAYETRETSYWSLADAVNAGAANPHTGSEDEIIDGLEKHLGAAVSRQMVADVPVGAFLSGGIDSSLVVALMQASAKQRVNTYSIGFDSGDDEAPHARAVAKHIGTEHTELYITAADMLDAIPDMPRVHDEPFADASQIPTLLLTRMARQHVTVALTGDGGDEIFGGYAHYRFIEKTGGAILATPKPLRRIIAALNGLVPWKALEASSGYRINKIIGTGAQYGLAHKMQKLNSALMADGIQDLFARTIVTRWDDTATLVPGSDAGAVPVPMLDLDAGIGLARTARAFDMNRFLPDDILVKVDRAAMHVSLETRIPLLDHGVIEYGLAIPESMIARGGKHPLREILYRHVPRALVDRPKTGFGPPVSLWLKGALREWAGDMLAPGRLRADGFFDEKTVTAKWSDYVSGRRDWSPHLWSVLMFQAWLAAQ